MKNINLSDLDLLIFYYIEECGYFHSAFTFNQESKINFYLHINKNFPPGLLLSLYQRGIIYSLIEKNSSPIFRNNSRSPIENFLFDRSNFLSNFYRISKPKDFQDNMLYFSNNYSIHVFSWHPRKLILFLGTKDSKIFRLEIRINGKKIKVKKILIEFNKIKYKFINNKLTNEKNIAKNDVTSMDINFNGTIIATGFENGKLVLFSETGKILMYHILCFDLSILEIKWSENSRNIIIGDIFGNIFLYSCWYGIFLSKFSCFKACINCLDWLNIFEFVGFSNEKIIGFFRVSEKKIELSQIHLLKINEIAIFQSQKIISSCSDDKKISIINLKNGMNFEGFLIGHEKEISSILWSLEKIKKFKKKNLKFLLYSCSLDFCIKIWNVKKKIVIQTFLQKNALLSISWNNLGKDLFIILPKGDLIKMDKKKKKARLFRISNKVSIEIKSHPIANKQAFLCLKTIFIL